MERRDNSERVSLRDLSKLYWLGVQIQEIEQRLDDLEREKAQACVRADVKDSADKLRNRLWQLRRRALEEELQLRECIEQETDSQMRAILTQRFIHGKSWTAVAMTLGGGNTASGVKARFYRWLKNNHSHQTHFFL